MKKIILVSGKAQSGKDTYANFIKQELEKKGERVVITHFAKYLKQILRDYYGWNGVDKTEFWRTKLQEIGTDIIRHKLQMPTFHAQRIGDDIKVVKNDFDYIIVPDTRFRNEVRLIQAMFPDEVISVRIHRLGWESPLTLDQQNHISETDLDEFEFDFNIYSQSGIEHLMDETMRVFKGILF